MKWFFFTSLAFCLLFVCACKSRTTQAPEKTQSFPPAPDKIAFISIHELDAAMKKEPRPVMIDMYTDWCGWCKKMEKKAFHDKKVAQFVHEKMYAVQFDAESTDDVVFKGRTYGTDAYAHSLARSLMNDQLSYPTIVYLDKDQNLITAVPGFKDAFDLLIDLKYFGEGHYLTTGYETFKMREEENY